tara:strand:+ start:51 stop:257 length:207 start_codon:yes stop_codon:yes gene_type:complete
VGIKPEANSASTSLGCQASEEISLLINKEGLESNKKIPMNNTTMSAIKELKKYVMDLVKDLKSFITIN